MAKIDDTIEAIQNGFKQPEWRSGNTWVPDEQMESLQVRRRKADLTHHLLVYFSVGEAGQTPAMFWGHRLSDCLKKALAWRGLPTSKKRQPKNGAPAQAPG